MFTEITTRKKVQRDLDFSDKENRVIDILIHFKIAKTVAKIAREVNMPRSTVADILERLRSRRMITRIPRKTKKGTRYEWMIKRFPATDKLYDGYIVPEI